MSDWLMRTIRSETQRLLELAADDSRLRDELHALAGEILEAVSRLQAESTGKTDGAPAVPHAEEPLRPLTLGQARSPSSGGVSSPGEPPKRSTSGSGVNLATMEARCRSKADAARWVAESQRRLREGTEAPVPGELADAETTCWAETLRDAFFFSTAKSASGPVDLSLLDDVAGCFDTVAESLAVVGEPPRQRKAHERVLRYVAEAQSALRRALDRLDIHDDPDQEDVYEWLRATAARDRVYLPPPHARRTIWLIPPGGPP